MQRQWPPSYLSICGIGDEGDSSKCCASPSPCIPSNGPTANEILRRGARKHDLAYVYHILVPRTTTSLSLVSRARTCTYVHTYVRREARHRSSIDPKRIRGKRARRWINTKTSVTHDQAEPSSAISSCFALAQTSPCAAVAFFFHVHVHATVYACECACIFFILVPVFSFSSPLSYPAHNALYATPI